MAPRFKTKKHTLSGGWESLQSIFAAQDLIVDDYIGAVTVRAARANVGDTYWADSDGSEGGFLGAREAAHFELDGKFVRAPEILFKGTVGEIIYLTYLAP